MTHPFAPEYGGVLGAVQLGLAALGAAVAVAVVGPLALIDWLISSVSE